MQSSIEARHDQCLGVAKLHELRMCDWQAVLLEQPCAQPLVLERSAKVEAPCPHEPQRQLENVGRRRRTVRSTPASTMSRQRRFLLRTRQRNAKVVIVLGYLAGPQRSEQKLLHASFLEGARTDGKDVLGLGAFG